MHPALKIVVVLVGVLWFLTKLAGRVVWRLTELIVSYLVIRGIARREIRKALA